MLAMVAVASSVGLASLRSFPRVDGTGRHEDELRTHLRGALNLGWAVEEMFEALLQTGAYAGFTAAHEALDALKDVAVQE